MDAPAYQSSWVKGPDHAAAQTRTTSRWKRPSLCKVLRQWSQEHIRYDAADRSGINTEQVLPWKPAILRAPVLLSMIILTVSLIAILQSLLWRSQRLGGIVLAPDLEKLPLSTTFAYLYLPTTVAVLYSMLWSWVDLDAKRLEPYFQLSKQEGASAENSLLLHYPFDFVALVPLKAFKRRHWSVFCASTAMVIVFWGITPLQSAIFATENITLSDDLPLWSGAEVGSSSNRNSTLTAEYFASVFGISWLNETLPPFMTREYALAPFGPIGTDKNRKAETWTAQTQLFSVDLDCEPAIIRDDGPPSPSSRSFLGHGCETTMMSDISQNAGYVAYYAGYWNTGFADYYLSTQCPLNSSHVSFIAWSKTRLSGSDPKPDAATLFCEAKYYHQVVNATVSAVDRQVIKISDRGPKLPLPEEFFNTTTFEAELNAGVKMEQRSNLPQSSMPDPNLRLQGMDLVLPTTIKMIGYAVAAEKRSSAEYLDPVVLQRSFQAAYRLLFASSLADMLESGSSNEKTRLGVRSYITGSVVLVPTFVYLVEGLLALIALLAAILTCIHLKRPRKLIGDPAAIAATMTLVADSDDLPDHFSELEYRNTQTFESSLRSKRFRFARSGDHRLGYKLESMDNHVPSEKDSGGCHFFRFSPKRRVPEEVSRADVRPSTIRPVEFTLPVGVVFVSLLLCLFVFVAVIRSRSRDLNGLERPSSHRFVRQLLLNYIPTVIATFLEPVWVVLNRLLCMLQPFEELHRGRATPSVSLSSTYTSLPPQLVIWKAFRSKHYLLTAVCGMALLANLLAVSLSGLFYENMTSISTARNFSLPYKPLFKNFKNSDNPISNSSFDHFYVARANVTRNAPMPPWTDKDQFFLPFSVPTDGGQRYRASTHAIGAHLNCLPLQSGTPNFIDLSMHSMGEGANLTVSMTRDDGAMVTCQPRLLSRDSSIRAVDKFDPSPQTFVRFSGVPDGSVALELSTAMDSMGENRSTTKDQDFCQELIVSGWLRANVSLDQDLQIFSSDQMFMGCRPSVRIGVADVLVDSSGYVLESSHPASSVGDIRDYFISRPTDLYGQVAQFTPSSGANWHNDSLASDWTNYLIEHMFNNTKMLDPGLPVPSFEEAVPRVQTVYSKVFAIILATNTGALLAPSNETTVNGKEIRNAPRIFISKPMFVISEIILGLYVVVALTMYILRPAKFLPRLPTTIASIISYVYASHALADFRGTIHMCTKQREKHLEKLGHTYGYQRFTGKDGKEHLGIEQQPLLVASSKESKLDDNWI